MAALSPAPRFYETDANGAPLSFGKVYTYQSGTSTPLATYQSASGSANTNPVILSASGKANIWLLTTGLYRFVVTDANDVPQYTVDSIGGSASYADLSNTTDVALGDALIGFKQSNSSGALSGAVGSTVHVKLQERVSALDFMTSAQKTDVTTNAGVIDVTAAIQAGIDVLTSGGTLWLPTGTYLITSTLYLKRSGIRISGDGFENTNIKFVNVSGGTAFAGTVSDLSTITNCEISEISLISTAAATDPSIGVDITTFSYSRFDMYIQTKRTNAVCVYGEGNSGSSPYYNVISGSLFGDPTPTQTGIQFVGGAWAGGSNGPNANIIGPIRRAAALAYFADLQSGNGNLFSNINGESIATAHFRLNYAASPVETGTSSGSNNMAQLIDSSKSWDTNEYTNHAVKITAGTGSGQVRIIGSNNGTTLTLKQLWGVLPDNTSEYSIYKNYALGTKVHNYRGEGSSGADFISAFPGTQLNYFSGSFIDSLGAGLWVRDDSGATDNSWFDGSKTALTFDVQNPGVSANINLIMKNSTLGGFRPMGGYVVESLSVNSSTSSLGDTATVLLDVGGTAPGNGDMTLTVALPDGETGGSAIPTATEKIRRDSSNRGLFINVSTGGSFSATADLQVTAVVYIGV